MADFAISHADTVLINSSAFVVRQVVFDPDRQELYLDVMREVVNRSNWDHPFVGPLVQSVRQLLDQNPDKRRPLRQGFAFEVNQIEQQLQGIFEWRAGVSLEHHRQLQSEMAQAS